jgi:hypothetical protein
MIAIKISLPIVLDISKKDSIESSGVWTNCSTPVKMKTGKIKKTIMFYPMEKPTKLMI